MRKESESVPPRAHRRFSGELSSISFGSNSIRVADSDC
jgi:hypothetical protein